DVDLEGVRLQKRAKAFMVLCASTSLIGLISLAALNIWAAVEERLVILFSPRYPVLSPLLFCLLAVATVRGLFLTGLKASGTANQSRRTRVTLGNSSGTFAAARSWTEELKASGKHFHAKSACLEVLQLLNQIVGLRRLLYLGQANLWICSYAILICLNSVVTPLLHLSSSVQRNTFFLVLFDAFVDAMFGAVLPACMVAEVAYKYQMGIDFDFVPHDAKFVQAFLIGGRLVPTSPLQLVALIWPYISLWVKLLDLRDARELWCHRSVEDRRNRLCGPRFGMVYLFLGLTSGLLGMTARKSWVDGCRVFRFDLLGLRCECTFYERRQCDSADHEQSIEEMLKESHGLQFLVLERCGGSEFFPSLRQNVKLEFLYISAMSQLKFFPPLDDLVALRDLQITGSQLEWLPDLSKNKALESLNVEQNCLKYLPSLKGLSRLEFLVADQNNLEEFPDIDPNSRLSFLQLNSNRIESVPSLPFPGLKELHMSANFLTALPPLEELRQLEALDVGWNRLTEIPPLKHLTQLRYLNVMKNNLYKMPSLQSNTELRMVDVSRNKLKHVPTLENAHHLEMLSMNSNKVEEMPGISSAAPIDSLNLGWNELRSLNLTGPQYMSMRVLDARSNQLEWVAGVESMSSLQRLELDWNRLTALSVRLPRTLRHLSVSNNRLTKLASLGLVPKLVKLKASNNQLQSVDGLHKMHALVVCNLEHNNLTSLPSLEAMTSLEIMSLGFNALTEFGPLHSKILELLVPKNKLLRLPDLSHMRSLQRLDVSFNDLEVLPSLDRNIELVELDVSYNQLAELPDLSQLHHLGLLYADGNHLLALPPLARTVVTEICVQDNQIQELPDFSGYEFLRTLACSGNPLRKLPPNPNSCDCCEDTPGTKRTLPANACDRPTIPFGRRRFQRMAPGIAELLRGSRDAPAANRARGGLGTLRCTASLGHAAGPVPLAKLGGPSHCAAALGSVFGGSFQAVCHMARSGNRGGRCRSGATTSKPGRAGEEPPSADARDADKAWRLCCAARRALRPLLAATLAPQLRKFEVALAKLLEEARERLSSFEQQLCHSADLQVNTESPPGRLVLDLRGELPVGVDGKLPLRHEIHAEHADKLKRLFVKEETLGDFNTKCWVLLTRYRALFGPHDEGAGWHMALTSEVFECLQDTFGVQHELFASPLNCTLPSYCSIFPDTDRDFGSKGGFFRFCEETLVRGGSFECNPPFEEGLLARAVAALLRALAAEGPALSVVLVLPAWPGSAAMEMVCSSHFVRASTEVSGEDHCYLNG
ncbi:inlI, partial [Symbiodinium sp. CCMP2456]